MAGTILGGKRAGETNKQLYTEDYYAVIGRIGGLKGHTGGFYQNRELARIAGAKGGRKSQRMDKGIFQRGAMTAKAKKRLRAKRNRQAVAQAYAHLHAIQEQARAEREASYADMQNALLEAGEVV